MDKFMISECVAYIDMLSGKLHELSLSNSIMGGKPVVFCNPEAFKEMADQLADCSRIIRKEMLGGS